MSYGLSKTVYSEITADFMYVDHDDETGMILQNYAVFLMRHNTSQ